MNKFYLTILLVSFYNLPAYGQSGGAYDLDTPESEPYVMVEGGVNFEVSLKDDPLAPLEVIKLPKIRLTSGEDGELQTYLSLGETAPWSGLLLNPPAIAFIVSEYEGLAKRAEAALDKQRKSDWNRLNLEVNKLKLRLVSQAKTNEVIVTGLKEENARLAKIHEDYVDEKEGGFWNSDFGEVFKYGLIVVGSAAAGIVVGYVAAGAN